MKKQKAKKRYITFSHIQGKKETEGDVEQLTLVEKPKVEKMHLYTKIICL